MHVRQLRDKLMKSRLRWFFNHVQRRKENFVGRRTLQMKLPGKKLEKARSSCGPRVKARFHYERGKKHSLFVLLLFFALASILTARFNRRSIKETKNALFHARSENGPLFTKMK